MRAIIALFKNNKQLALFFLIDVLFYGLLLCGVILIGAFVYSYHISAAISLIVYLCLVVPVLTAKILINAEQKNIIQKQLTKSA